MIALDTGQLVTIAISVVGGTTLAGIATLLRVRSDVGAVTVTAAQGVVVMQRDMLSDLRGENESLKKRVTALERLSTTYDELRGKIKDLERENTALVAENDRLRDRVRTLETVVAELKRDGVG